MSGWVDSITENKDQLTRGFGAFLLAAIQEYLCQISQQLTKGPRGGLLNFLNL